MELNNKKLIILDRDGVINHDSPDFIKSTDEWLPLDGSIEAIKRLKNAGKIVAVATNQSGVARGLFDLATLDAMHQKFYHLLAEQNVQLDGLVYCPHGPDDNCDCRKPKPGMILTLLKRFALAPEEAVLVGDSLRDLQAAEAVGVDAVLVKTGKGEKVFAEKNVKNPVFDNLLAFATAVCDE
jgi:D-glycero-D-manno-heptose 1,7-bisphosphate phosphatase